MKDYRGSARNLNSKVRFGCYGSHESRRRDVAAAGLANPLLRATHAGATWRTLLRSPKRRHVLLDGRLHLVEPDDGAAEQHGA